MQLIGRNLEIRSFWKPQDKQTGTCESLGVTKGAAHGQRCKQAGKGFSMLFMAHPHPVTAYYCTSLKIHPQAGQIDSSLCINAQTKKLLPFLSAEWPWNPVLLKWSTNTCSSQRTQEPGEGHLPGPRFFLLPCSLNNCNFCLFPPDVCTLSRALCGVCDFPH